MNCPAMSRNYNKCSEMSYVGYISEGKMSPFDRKY